MCELVITNLRILSVSITYNNNTAYVYLISMTEINWFFNTNKLCTHSQLARWRLRCCWYVWSSTRIFMRKEILCVNFKPIFLLHVYNYMYKLYFKRSKSVIYIFKCLLQFLRYAIVHLFSYDSWSSRAVVFPNQTTNHIKRTLEKKGFQFVVN